MLEFYSDPYLMLNQTSKHTELPRLHVIYYFKVDLVKAQYVGHNFYSCKMDYHFLKLKNVF